ncbi:hypothetical protein GUITHDRAFT_147476 [Guillardia theta CCMP2712]|uniref:Uncharacterized protein n=1 Tax=Guillardia theta (strain CCMP2712) TaxID=905079 RepID=L1IDU2_GUITC|nr:hypothetical protein GUITHDRAFT_147476 [Guillardia theta CCMP2712]EKX34079.1 hypothetical protein GUITHDRAFT_147476 [Guillardia theta CCMP2712]|eukprot:XP_005821059.1 hypothetical protein GUITHDRAFT_147476 [Guillardia theta CCMP2712]
MLAAFAPLHLLPLPSPSSDIRTKLATRASSSSSSLTTGRFSILGRRKGRLGEVRCSGTEGGEVGEPGADWRSFRAKLVAQEKSSSTSLHDSDEWAYNAGEFVEQGSVLLGGSETMLGFGLRQQYFHKCVLLVLYHNKDFTKGVIINRPTLMTTKRGWRRWYGGDVQGITAPEFVQEEVCLHRIQHPAAQEVSATVIEGVSYCSLQDAERLVEAGVAKKEDFWLLVGYAGWAPGQLQNEIDQRNSWHVASASSVLLNQLINQAATADTMDAGISVWETLMSKIGLKEKIEQDKHKFADEMLREWTRTLLADPKPDSKAVEKLLEAARRRQERNTKINFKNDQAIKKRRVHFGGEYAFGSSSSSSAVLWLHGSKDLLAAGCGSLVAKEEADGEKYFICKCSGADAVKAISRKEASEDDFMLITGFCIWPKGKLAVETTRQQASKGLTLPEGGLEAEIDAGKFHVLDRFSYDDWQKLVQQADPAESLVDNGTGVWETAAGGEERRKIEGNQEERRREQLADEALEEFVRLFLSS